LFDNHVVVYKTEGDTMLFVVGSAEENEILLFNAVLALRDSLNILLKTSVDRRTMIENYDLVCLAIDELCDDGKWFFFFLTALLNEGCWLTSVKQTASSGYQHQRWH
jgi:hypothetical protein